MMPFWAASVSKSAAWRSFNSRFSTSSPTYPASVSVVASPMAKGTAVKKVEFVIEGKKKDLECCGYQKEDAILVGSGDLSTSLGEIAAHGQHTISLFGSQDRGV